MTIGTTTIENGILMLSARLIDSYPLESYYCLQYQTQKFQLVAVIDRSGSSGPLHFLKTIAAAFTTSKLFFFSFLWT